MVYDDAQRYTEESWDLIKNVNSERANNIPHSFYYLPQLVGPVFEPDMPPILYFCRKANCKVISTGHPRVGDLPILKVNNTNSGSVIPKKIQRPVDWWKIEFCQYEDE